MAEKLCKKRPCSICRKWFKPDVRQKGRQKTCSPDCSKERHRRQCKKWNNKNKEYFKNNYLDHIIEKIETVSKSCQQQGDFNKQQSHTPVLPCEIIKKEYGIKTVVIIQYITRQIINQIINRSAIPQ